MNFRKTLILSVLAAGAFAQGFADNYSDFVKYNAGDSLEWFYSLRTQSQDAKVAAEVSRTLLNKIASEKLSDEAFRLACNLLKPIADSDAVDVLKPYLLDPVRAPYVCDVLLGIDSGRVDSALKEVLNNASAQRPAKENALAAIAARGKDKTSVIRAASDLSDKQLAEFAVRSLARFTDSTGVFALFDTSVVDFLKGVVAANDFRKQAAQDSLIYIADRAIMAGDKTVAKSALAVVPETPDTIFARSELMSDADRVAYLDKLIADGGALSGAAARAMNRGRTFENSQWLVSKFPSLNKKAKLAAMGGFMLTGDTRFYPTIAPEMDNPDADIKALAVYSARFLCVDEPSLVKIFKIYKSGEEPMCKFAENVLAENSSHAVQRVLKENADAGDMQALELLIRRGDAKSVEKLWKMFFDEKTRTPAVSRMLENTITSGQVRELASHYKTADAELSKEITKIIIKKIMQYRLSREYMATAVKQALDGNLSPDSQQYKFIVAKLKLGDLIK